jgi:hypothetical protein
MSSNPLKQYFRRPALYIKLPSNGQGYAQGDIEMTETGDLPVFPMTAIDEITVRTPDALFNGTAVVELIKSCVPNIKNPWAVSSIDLEALFVAIKSASQGSEIEMESECPACKETGKYGVNLTAMLMGLKSGDYSVELNIDELYFKFRPLTFKEMNDVSMTQFNIQQKLTANNNDSAEEAARKNQEAVKTVIELSMELIAGSIEYIKTPVGVVKEKEYFSEYLKNCDKNVFAKIRDYVTELKEKSESPPLPITCVNCQHPYETKFTLNITDFFG